MKKLINWEIFRNMINVNLKKRKQDEQFRKAELYRIQGEDIVCFTEEHEHSKEKVWLYYDLKEQEYGIYASEYKRPGLVKKNCKTTDVLSCVLNEKTKEIFTLIFDVKSNISSFSNDLTKENAIKTAVNEIRDFTQQVQCEILHKESFMIYYRDGGFTETEKIGIVTKNFEEQKFMDAALWIEKIFSGERKNISPLLQWKLKNSFEPYLSEVERLKLFSKRKLLIGNKRYDLQVYLLEKKSDSEYEIKINAEDGSVKNNVKK